MGWEKRKAPADSKAGLLLLRWALSSFSEVFRYADAISHPSLLLPAVLSPPGGLVMVIFANIFPNSVSECSSGLPCQADKGTKNFWLDWKSFSSWVFCCHGESLHATCLERQQPLPRMFDYIDIIYSIILYYIK